jgi:hypothetical protein
MSARQYEAWEREQERIQEAIEAEDREAERKRLIAQRDAAVAEEKRQRELVQAQGDELVDELNERIADNEKVPV